MDKIRRNFLWCGSENGSSCKSLVKWSAVCKSKREGGLGIINLQLFNFSLMSKWMWKVLAEDSLFSRTIKSIYSSNLPSLSCTPPTSSASKFWHDVYSCSLAFRGLVLWKLGEGSYIRFWEDKWTGYNTLASLFPLAYQLALSANVSVCSQGHMNNGRWHWHLLIRRPISPQEIEEVHNIYNILKNYNLGTNSGNDMVWWPYNKTRMFSVKSLYSILNASGIFFHGYDLTWKSSTPLKVKVFFWLLIRRKLNTKLNLAHKGWTGETVCSICSSESESHEHLFLHCKFTKEVWSFFLPLLNLNILPHNLSDFVDGRGSFIQDRGSKAIWPIVLPAICWCLWRTRNNAVFQQSFLTPREVAAKSSYFIIFWAGNHSSKRSKKIKDLVDAREFHKLLLRDRSPEIEAEVGDSFQL